MSTPINILQPAASSQRLAKVITDTMTQPYPLVARFNSTTSYVESGIEGLEKLYDTLLDASRQGAALLKGPLREPIINERRKGKSDRTGPTCLMVLDVDGWVPTKPLRAPITQAALKEAAEEVANLLPEPLCSTSYIVNASSSTGTKSGGEIGLHMFFLLERAIAPGRLETYLQSLNFYAPEFESQITLQASNMAVKWVIDPVVARNTQIIYIAPPEFSGRDDPFTSPDDRWALVKKTFNACDLFDDTAQVNDTAIKELAAQQLTKLRKLAGLTKLNPRYRTLNIGGRHERVITNPDPLKLEYVSHNDTFVYWNVNGGDSNAYYNPIGNPEIIFNFKGEMPFEMKKASPETYEWYCERFKVEIRETTESRPLVFRDLASDTHYAVEYIPAHEEVVRCDKIASQNIEDWIAQFGRTPPDPIPQWTMTFDPKSTTVLDFDKRILNQFQPTHFLKSPPAIMPRYTSAKLGEVAGLLPDLCPTIHTVIYHICGSSAEDYEWFMNWLAWCVQEREKAHTAWIFSGVPGTGKGIFYERILRPLIGEKYAHRKRIDHLEEQFNAYQSTALFLTYEEFRMRDSAHQQRLLNKLKDDIVADRVNIRAMRTDVVEQRSYTNYIFFSNHKDVMPIEEGDRRFNVAPPQTQKLLVAYPEFDKEIKKIDAELGTFAGFLMAMDTDERAVRTCRENAAKANMKSAAMGYGQRFCLALRHGDLPYFLDLLDYDSAGNVATAVKLQTAQKYVKAWAKDYAAGRDSQVPVTALLACYELLTDSKMTPNLFSRFLHRNDVETRRARMHGKLQRLSDIRWHVSDTEDQAFIEELIREPDDMPPQNVAAIHNAG